MRLHLKRGKLARGPAVLLTGPRRMKREPGLYGLNAEALVFGIGCRDENSMRLPGLRWIRR